MIPREDQYVRHCFFPSLFVAKSAKGKTSITSAHVTSELSSPSTIFWGLSAQVESTFARVVPNHGTLPASAPYNPATSQLTSRQDVGRGRFDHPAGSRNAGTQYYPHAANLDLLPPDVRMSGRALLKRGYVTQALIDSTAVLFCFLFILSVALSIPFAIFLLLFARF